MVIALYTDGNGTKAVDFEITKYRQVLE